MTDPLGQFDWTCLHEEYDKQCRKGGRFNPNYPAIKDIAGKHDTDRELYYSLVDMIKEQRQISGFMSLRTYEAIIYWKMYSTSPQTNIVIRGNPEVRMSLVQELYRLSDFPEDVSRDVKMIRDLVDQMLDIHLYGMGLPVCTTVLHFMYPKTIPIFDRMILEGVGFDEEDIKKKKLNQDRRLFAEYAEHNWELSEKYTKHFVSLRESPTRAIDMALWVTRDKR